MSATTDSGTPPFSPRRPSGTRNCSSICKIAARGVLELDPDRHQPVAGVEFRQRRADVADGGDADGLRQAFGGDAEPGGEIGPRLDAQLGPVERGFRDHVGDQRNPLHLRRQFAGDVADDVAVGAGDHQRNRAQAVLVEEPVADIGNVLELAADLELELALGDARVAVFGV